METINWMRSRLPLLLFWGGISVVVLWILQMKFFPTYDGPSHLYNSFLLAELLSGENQLILDHFTANPWWKSNNLGHWLQLILMKFTTPIVAEKLFVILVILMMASALNFWTHNMNSNNNWPLVVILPLLFSDIFFFGFFNFLLGVSGLIAGVGFWFKNRENSLGRKNILIWLGIFLFTYFSHLVAFGFLIVALFIIESYQYFVKRNFTNTQLLGWGSAAILPLLGAMIQLATPPSNVNSVWLGFGEIVKRLFTGHVLVAFDFREEGAFSISFAFVVLALFFFAIVIHFVEKVDALGFKGRALGLLVSLFFLLLFVLPDEVSGGGFLIDRLLLLFFSFTILWIGVYFQQRIWFLALAGLSSLLIFLGLFRYHRTVYQDLNQRYQSIELAAESIEEGATVIPVFRDANWYTLHHAKYVGLLSKSLILNNYEAETGYFPLSWNYNNIPDYRVGAESGVNFPCDVWTSNPKNQSKTVDYILWQGEEYDKEKDCDLGWATSLLHSFELINEVEGWLVYKAKPRS
ncbi:MAG: hypothetical protein LAT76_11510 [Schleiferiaceae bacterium]|nr:hypothetical protein [Schleiferiaceae bacterium]